MAEKKSICAQCGRSSEILDPNEKLVMLPVAIGKTHPCICTTCAANISDAYKNGERIVAVKDLGDGVKITIKEGLMP